MGKLLVTGGAGFIGSEFVRQAVARGYRVVVVDKLTYAGDLERLKSCSQDIVFCRADITNQEFINHIFKTEKPSAVVHWAAESHVDRSILDASPFLKTNIEGTQVVLEAARNHGVEKFINISTDEVYGDLDATGQFYETTPLNPSSPYSVSKAGADMLGRAYYRTYGLPVITVRPSNNYGPWQYPEKLIPVVILKAKNGEKIPVYGKGQNVREWLFVSDCAEAVMRVLEHAKPGSMYNVGSGEEHPNIDIVREILKTINVSDNRIQFVKDRLGHDFRYSLNSEKIRKELGWQPRASFADALQQTVQWYLDNKDWTKSKLEYLAGYWNKVYT